MPNTNVFRGSDATLVLAVDDKATEEGKLADGLINEYDFSNIVGRLRNVQVNVHNEVRPYHEIGKRFPSELRPGNVNVSGVAERAHINGALLRLLLGDAANSPPPADPLAQPTFNIVISLKNPALPDNSSKLVLFGVKFENWNFSLPEDDFVMEAVTFRALRIGSEETAG
ncbi:MAG: hypothetical protein IM473_21975 [Microcystis sp. M015S2]|jgi:hypothetical protein|uniref:Uncharacterized protein n=2 Tax=Microcystis aeruginosa TaxID=1126 RepID=A0AAD3AZF7_MICAE|nr:MULTISPECIES: hypothetical protein [Microcystis]NCS00455.1 hypothetical protein [Microcystis aeruginosa L311-01]OCY13497.1 MAG: hypothetical protein BEV12_23445 [Microcystis aeruginosa CACIAM 03]TRU09509.1 MAG: hypothetical protein EWV58_22040 [Microcystis aeruginosa Ma_MB_F_20061100_S19]TRU16118.1 MAG: hypothetical protein EWV59_02605 [Microcystis aeruginosa Ma_MB_F_20061100_S19D]EPF21342.1 hypothetical protein MAESPC_02777 [Microcystis aeruginosa SPC777]